MANSSYQSAPHTLGRTHTFVILPLGCGKSHTHTHTHMQALSHTHTSIDSMSHFRTEWSILSGCKSLLYRHNRSPSPKPPSFKKFADSFSFMEFIFLGRGVGASPSFRIKFKTCVFLGCLIIQNKAGRLCFLFASQEQSGILKGLRGDCRIKYCGIMGIRITSY